MRYLLPVAFFACFLWPARAQATQPAANCNTGTGATSCTLTIAAGELLFVGDNGFASCTVPTDTKSLTWTLALNSSWASSGFGTLHFCAYTAPTVANSGSDTVTFSAGSVIAYVHAWAGTDVSTTSPVDSSCFSGAVTVAAGGSSFTGCTLHTLSTNTVLEYQSFQDAGGSCSFGAPTAVTAGPTVQSYSLPACRGDFNNVTWSSTVVLIPSGAPFNTSITFTTSNTSGGNAVAAAQLIALASGTTPVTAQPAPYIIKYHPPEKFTPLLLYTILRNWIKETYEGRA